MNGNELNKSKMDLSAYGLAWSRVLHIALVIVKTKRWREILTGLVLVALTAGATDFCTNMIKKSAGRVRPYNSVPGTNYYSKGSKEWKQLPADFVQKKKRGHRGVPRLKKLLYSTESDPSELPSSVVDGMMVMRVRTAPRSSVVDAGC